MFDPFETPDYQRAHKKKLIVIQILAMTVLGCLIVWAWDAFSQGQLPGTDESSKLEAAGTLLRLIDTGLFKWGARIFAGVCIMSSAWALKEQRFGIAIICIVGAIIFGTAPTWVKNIFEIGGAEGVFGLYDMSQPTEVLAEEFAAQGGSLFG